MMMKIFIAVAVLTFGLWYLIETNEEAMRLCQIEHSFDTCFHSLNR